MSDRAKKSIGQDLVGVLFCLLGGFFAVSIYLHWRGQEPVVGFATRPVLELVRLLGPVAALVLSLGMAGIGAWVFLSSIAPAIGRACAAFALGSVGFAFVLGAFAHGGSLGDVFPGLVDGVTGRLIGAVLGVVALFLAATFLVPRRAGASTADVMRAGLGARGDLAAGVSQAEAALLGGEPRPVARPAPRREEKREEPRRETSVRPIASEAKVRGSAPAVASPVPAPVKESAELPAPSAPSWEQDELDEEPEAARRDEGDREPEDEEEERELAAELAEALADDEPAEEPDEEAEAAPVAGTSAAVPPPASWEQVGLFDEPEEPAAEPEPVRPAPVVTPTFAFEEPPATRHEPERATADDPFAAEPVTPPAPAVVAAEAESDGEEEEEVELDELDEEEELEAELVEEAEAEEPTPELTPVVAAKSAPSPEFVLQPAPAPRPEPVVERDGERERWEKLVFDSGALIVEQKRVAVSMLERRFAIDFDTACKVLDELQQAGLIGPYIGGRTREILLTREQWLAQAPQTA